MKKGFVPNHFINDPTPGQIRFFTPRKSIGNQWSASKKRGRMQARNIKLYGSESKETLASLIEILPKILKNM